MSIASPNATQANDPPKIDEQVVYDVSRKQLSAIELARSWPQIREIYIVGAERSGKTHTGAAIHVEMCAKYPSHNHLVLGPEYQDLWAGAKITLEQELGAAWRANGKWSERPTYHQQLTGGGVAYWRSAVKDVLSMSVLSAWVDEADTIPANRFYDVRSRLTDNQGLLIATTTPYARDRWVQERVEDASEVGIDASAIKVFHLDQWDNPKIAKAEIERAQRELPEAEYKRRVLGQWVEGANAVFGWDDIQLCAEHQARMGPAIHGHRYLIGADLAKMQDYTVIVVLDVTQVPYQIVAFERWRGMDWGQQVEKIASIGRKYEAPIVVDSSGVGDPIYDLLMDQRGISVTGVKTGVGREKENIIRALSLMICYHELAIPQTLDTLMSELRFFQAEQLPSGAIRYAAPSNDHDDCVIALALAASQISRYRPGRIIRPGPQPDPDEEMEPQWSPVVTPIVPAPMQVQQRDDRPVVTGRVVT